MQVIKIKRKFTFWWRTYRINDMKIVVGEDGLCRPTVVLWLVNGDYLYIGAETIKELKVFVEKDRETEATNGIPDGGGVQSSGSE